MNDTTLIGGRKVSKGSNIIELIGTLDELNYALGLAMQKNSGTKRSIMKCIQWEVEAMMSFIASGCGNDNKFSELWDLRQTDVDSYVKKHSIKRRRGFIPPRNEIDFARAVCRRAERVAVRAMPEETICDRLNKLGDHLYSISNYFDERVR